MYPRIGLFRKLPYPRIRILPILIHVSVSVQLRRTIKSTLQIFWKHQLACYCRITAIDLDGRNRQKVSWNWTLMECLAKRGRTTGEALWSEMTKTSLSRQEQAEKVSCWTHSTQSSWVAWWACRKLLGWDTLAKAALELVNLFFKCKEVKLCRLSAVRGIITEMKLLLATEFPSWDINVCNCACNRVAHAFAAHGCISPSGHMATWGGCTSWDWDCGD